MVGIFFFGEELFLYFFFFFSSRRRHTRSDRDWSSDVCSSDLPPGARLTAVRRATTQRGWTYAVLRPCRHRAPSTQGRQAVRPCPVSREAKPQPVRRCGDSRLIALGGLHRRVGNGPAP